jgi:hypothetical protein
MMLWRGRGLSARIIFTALIGTYYWPQQFKLFRAIVPVAQPFRVIELKLPDNEERKILSRKGSEMAKGNAVV